MVLPLRHPAALFTVLSLLSGLLTIAVTPPLRGPDENAHFLRAYGIARGDILAGESDAGGRKGLWLPNRVAAEFTYFDKARERAGNEGFSYHEIFRAFSAASVDGPRPDGPGGSVFKLYGGSEGYTPVPYLPYVAGAAVAVVANFGFLPTLYLMRLFGLLAVTAIIAYAIARTPVLRWGFFAVAMLPSAIFARSVVSADGAVLATTLIALAFCLSAVVNRAPARRPRAIWFAVCALTKPPQIAFVLLEAMAHRAGWRKCLNAVLVVAPAIALAGIWPLIAGTDIGAWRMYEADNLSPEQFQVGWKLRYMLAHPLHFPRAMTAGLDYSVELWRQLIGVLGWLDIKLHSLAYPVLTVLLAVASFDRLDLPPESRMRIAAVAAATAFAYAMLVFALLFITVTPVASDRVLGVQGRYFTVIVPLVALIAAAFNPYRLPRRVRSFAALMLALISVIATVEAVWRLDWAQSAPSAAG